MLLTRHNLRGQVLLMDLAISDKHDVANPELVHMLLDWIESGVVAALLVAPPCETWTESRYIEPREVNDPRPIRSAQDPFFLAASNMAEITQVTLSNYLLYVALMLLWRAALCAVPGVLEHPREPKKADRPTIWKLPWLSHLRTSGLMCQKLVWQAHYGSASAKPTHLAIPHLVQYERVMRRHRQHVNWSELLQLGGKDSAGKWKTAAAKEYPADFNLALADLHVSATLQRLRQQRDPEPVPEVIQTQFDHLYAGFVDLQQQVMQPDFHRSSINLLQVD